MTENKRKALETLAKVKEIYDSSESEILTAGFYSEFMKLVDEQIKTINLTVK